MIKTLPILSSDQIFMSLYKNKKETFILLYKVHSPLQIEKWKYGTVMPRGCPSNGCVSYISYIGTCISQRIAFGLFGLK